jgi:hypothetical protein
MAGTINADAVGKRFSRYARDRPTTLKQAMLRVWRHTRPIDSFWALRVRHSRPAQRPSLRRGRTQSLINQQG